MLPKPGVNWPISNRKAERHNSILRARTVDRIRAVVATGATICLLYFVADTFVLALILPLFWALLLRPIAVSEVVLFGVAALFFLLQNYVCLEAGLFEFRYKDILLMPYYEPFLWGFYLLTMKRFIGERQPPRRIDWRVIVGLVVTSLMFSTFSESSRTLLLATAGSTLLLLAFFHAPADIGFAVYSLILGFIIELFGVSTGLWSYPAPDFLGMPFWFATMWASVGILARRFAIPAAGWIAATLTD
jgi:hypothetical protein